MHALWRWNKLPLPAQSFFLSAPWPLHSLSPRQACRSTDVRLGFLDIGRTADNRAGHHAAQRGRSQFVKIATRDRIAHGSLNGLVGIRAEKNRHKNADGRKAFVDIRVSDRCRIRLSHLFGREDLRGNRRQPVPEGIYCGIKGLQMLRSSSSRLLRPYVRNGRPRTSARRISPTLRWSIVLGYSLFAVGVPLPNGLGKASGEVVSLHGSPVRLRLGRRVLAALLLHVAGGKADVGARASHQSADLCDPGSAAAGHRLDGVLRWRRQKTNHAMLQLLRSLCPRVICSHRRAAAKPLAIQICRQSFAVGCARRSFEVPRCCAKLAQPWQLHTAAGIARYGRSRCTHGIARDSIGSSRFALFSSSAAAAAVTRRLS